MGRPDIVLETAANIWRIHRMAERNWIGTRSAERRGCADFRFQQSFDRAKVAEGRAQLRNGSYVAGACRCTVCN